MMQAGAMAMNHSVQVMVIFEVFCRISRARRLGARAVRNMLLVTHVVAIAVHIT
jgi:hypothetical protein